MAGEIRYPDLRVVARILEALWRLGDRVRPTRLQQASGTNYTQFTRYLDLLVQRGLLSVETDAHGDRWISLTPKGQAAHGFLVSGLAAVLGATRPPP